MRVEDVIERVRVMVGDSDAIQFSDEQALAWINDGVRECAINNNLLQRRATSPSIVGTNEYSIPSDILKLYSVMYDNSIVPVMTKQEFDQWYTGVGTNNTERGGVRAAYIWAGKLTFYPAPDQVKSITIDYLYDPPQHTKDALNVEIGLPVSYHPRIVDYCLAQVAQQDDDINRYNMKMTEFKTGIQQLSDQSEYNQDLYPYISVSDRDAGDNAEYY